MSLSSESYTTWSDGSNLFWNELIPDARKNLTDFTSVTKPDYRWNWHHEVTCAKLDAFARGDIKYLMIFEPPRHGKSELTSRRLPAFLHGLYPDKQIMAASYSDYLAAKMTTAVQQIMDTAIYQQIFPGTKLWPQGTPYVKGVRNQNEHHIIGRRGTYMGQGVGGSYSGLGADFILVDDPIKGRKAADSPAFRKALWEFWLNDLFTRLETDLDTGREAQVLITQTRWHELDLSGMLIDQMKEPGAIQWEIVDFPAIRVDMDNPDDPRELGEPLWPQKYDLDQLNRIKTTIGQRAWSCLYQQSPVAQGGNIIKGAQFVRYKVLPKLKYRKIYADTAQKTKEANDYSVFECWGEGAEDGRIYLIDMIRGKWEAPELQKRAVAFWQKHAAQDVEKVGYLREMMVEDKSSGTGLIQTVKLQNQIPIKGIERNKDKLSRVNDALPYIESGMVCIPEDAPFTSDFVEECEAFTATDTHPHDDQIDPMVDAIDDMLSTKNKTKTWEKLGE